jgi:hypothetical protein
MHEMEEVGFVKRILLRYCDASNLNHLRYGCRVDGESEEGRLVPDEGSSGMLRGLEKWVVFRAPVDGGSTRRGKSGASWCALL